MPSARSRSTLAGARVRDAWPGFRHSLAQLDAACVFAEPQFEPTLVETVIEGTSAKKGVLDPLGAALEAGPEQYFQLMHGLADLDRSSWASEVVIWPLRTGPAGDATVALQRWQSTDPDGELEREPGALAGGIPSASPSICLVRMSIRLRPSPDGRPPPCPARRRP